MNLTSKAAIKKLNERLLTQNVIMQTLIDVILENGMITEKELESKIQENIEAAEKQRESSESKLKEYDEIILKSKLEAKNIFKDAREKVIKDISSKKEVLNKQIDQEIKKAEQEIELFKRGSPEKINKIAIETSYELLKKLIGAEVNNSSISAIVDDLSKRNGDKYYGN